MSIALPLAAENYLIESGLTQTEMLVVKKLLEENRLTLRELASKTGKGNSAIDAALKKLIQRGIVNKEKVNDQPRYTVLDPQSIVSWAERTLEERAAMMKRRHQSFAQFIGSISAEKAHPAVEHYEGEEGIIRAFDRLLQCRTELHIYLDPSQLPDTPAFQEFLQLHNRRRKLYGIFLRIIAPDTDAGRRFQSRDPFEYRKTVLVPAQEFPVSFMKAIAEDTVACIDILKHEASFIQFPKLADSERAAFEKLWEAQLQRDAQPTERVQTPNDTQVPLWTQLQSMNMLQKICMAIYAFFIVYWIALLMSGTTFAWLNLAYNFYGLPPMVFGTIGIASIWRWGGIRTTIGKAMFSIGLGILLWGLANTGWVYYNMVLNIPVPYPSVLDALFLPGSFFCGLGIVYLCDATGAAHGLRSPHAKLFALTAPIITLLVSYYLFITIARGGVLVSRDGSMLKTILDIAYPALDSLYLTAAVLISGLSFKYMRGMYALDIWLIMFGMVGMFLGDVIFIFTTTTGSFYPGNTGDLAYVSGLSFFSFGLLGFCREKVQSTVLAPV